MTSEAQKGPEYLVAKDARVRAFWTAFCVDVGLPETTDYQAWHFGDSAELAHALVDLVLHGPKRATTSLRASHERRPELSPILGGYSVICEFDGTPRGVVRTTCVEVCAFRDVDAQYAWDEGEGDRSLEDWRTSHWQYFGRECAALGYGLSEDMAVVLERFELLYPHSRTPRPHTSHPSM
jgi:uncharacterized protein YhfF